MSEPLLSKPRTDTERLANLEKVYLQQTTKALLVNKLRTVATMNEICKIAMVDPTYVYGHNNPTPEDLAAYQKFQKKVNDFAKDFVRLQKENEIKEIESTNELSAAREQLFKITIEKNDLLNKYLSALKKNKILESESLEIQLSTPVTNNAIPVLNENTLHIISPDKTLTFNDQYKFFNPELREKAWKDAKLEFQKLMNRNIPQRVFLLVGLPCSGKSTWLEKRQLTPDRHSVVIDATNLTSQSRSEWISLTRNCADLRIKAVVFLTDFDTILARNSQRHNEGKYLDVSILNRKREEFQMIDIQLEAIDEIEVIRED